jgi:hypothetical protein
MAHKGLERLQVALNRRNRAAAKVRRLEDELYEARQALDDLEREVRYAHNGAPSGTGIRFGRDVDWEIAPPAEAGI